MDFIAGTFSKELEMNVSFLVYARPRKTGILRCAAKARVMSRIAIPRPAGDIRLATYIFGILTFVRYTGKCKEHRVGLTSFFSDCRVSVRLLKPYGFFQQCFKVFKAAIFIYAKKGTIILNMRPMMDFLIECSLKGAALETLSDGHPLFRGRVTQLWTDNNIFPCSNIDIS